MLHKCWGVIIYTREKHGYSEKKDRQVLLCSRYSRQFPQVVMLLCKVEGGRVGKRESHETLKHNFWCLITQK